MKKTKVCGMQVLRLSCSRSIALSSMFEKKCYRQKDRSDDPILPCLLGCRDQKDTLKHYIMCPHVYAFQKFLLAEVSSDPLVRFGIKQLSIQSMKISSCLFSAYHAVKAKVRAGVIDVHEDTMTSTTIRVIWSVFAEAFAAEAGGLRAATFAFSFSKFICFVSTGILHSGELPNQNSLPALNH